MKIKWHIGERVRKRRKELGLTQEELAKRLGIGKVSVSNLEHDRDGVTFERLQKYADALNTTPQALLDWDNLDIYERFFDSIGISVNAWVDNMIIREDENGNPYEEPPEDPHYSIDISYHNKTITVSMEEYESFKNNVSEYIYFLLKQLQKHK